MTSNSRQGRAILELAKQNDRYAKIIAKEMLDELTLNDPEILKDLYGDDAHHMKQDISAGKIDAFFLILDLMEYLSGTWGDDLLDHWGYTKGEY